jgi:hypothetical protein
MGSLKEHTAVRGLCSFYVTGQVAHSADEAGCLGYIVNPEACDIIVTRSFLYGLVNSTGAANITVGNASTIAAAHDTTTLFAAAAQADSHGTAVTGFACGDPADSLPKVPEGDYIVAFGSADTSGYSGIFFFEYVRVPDYTA